MRMKIRNAALVGAIAAVAASAWATSSTISNSSYVPYYGEVKDQSIAASSESIPVTESLSPNESVVSEYAVTERTEAPRETRPVLVMDRSIERTAITIEERRLSADERIQSQVIDALARNTRLSGKIGVESYDSVVTLSGWTPTAAQARHAESDARGVLGVRDVRNQIRARVGGSV